MIDRQDPARMRPARRALLAACTLGLAGLAAGAETANPGQAPAVRFATAARWASESDGVARIRVQLSAPAASDLRLPIAVGGTAVPGKDFVLETNPLRIAAGSAEGEVVVRILADGIEEGVETVQLTLKTAPGAVVGTHGSFSLALGESGLGGPLDGLTADELAAFERGKDVFKKRFTPAEGLGPFYNAVSCESCHSKPVMGGSADTYRNFYLAVYQFGATPSSQSTSIAPFLSQVVPAFGSGATHAGSTFTLEGGRAILPSTFLGFPVLSTQRSSIPLFGIGLFEFISNAEITSRSDPNDLNGDGISGRVNTALAGLALGRFGVKCQSNNIELFTRAPLQNQMGITTLPLEGEDAIVFMPHSPLQVSGNPNDPTVDQDGIPDPEMGAQDLGDLIAFTKFLAPPQPVPFNADALAGEALFDQVGCTKCHVPSLPSTKGPVNAYTDLLIHYMGPALVDNMKFGEASTAITDFRTQPLWGISHVGPYLHDGRAHTLLDAILAHDGEGAAARTAFQALDATQQDQVITFLEHL